MSVRYDAEQPWSARITEEVTMSPLTEKEIAAVHQADTVITWRQLT